MNKTFNNDHVRYYLSDNAFLFFSLGCDILLDVSLTNQKMSILKWSKQEWSNKNAGKGGGKCENF